MIIDHKKYAKEYEEKKFWNKLASIPKSIGKKVIHMAIVLYVILSSKDTPIWVKVLIVAALGYFICPIDIVPDVIPFAGYIDDLAVLTLMIGEIAAYNTQDARSKARQIEQNMSARIK